MPAALRHTLLSLRDLWASAAPFVLLAILLLTLAYWWLDPMPPKRITLATGPAQSAYDELGKRYAQSLAAYGIQVQLKPSQGAADNLALLRAGEVDIGFVQGGTATPSEDDELESLGSLFVEPVWLFYRADAARKVNRQGKLTALGELKGLRLNLGAEGSGVPRLMERLFEANRIDPAGMRLSRLDQTPAVMALLAGEVDALVLASAPESLMVQMLLQTPDVRLMDFSQSEAYARRFAFLTPVTLPRGVVDLAKDIPAQDVHLIATTTTLLATPDVHPALLQLFSQAALKLHGPAGWFNRAREFPNAGQTEFPLAQEAERTLKNGAPLLQRYLSFTLANLLERMWLALGIIIAILLPLSRIVPPLYEFRIRSRVFRWYGQLRQIEERMQSGDGSREELLQALNQLEGRATRVKVPLSYADELYALRNYIEMVRSRLQHG
ncbi:MAG: ABC transporter substrate-binding protein [Burkholderiales bacterium]|nr:ABC transporter substrate-binding protein [Burkholderiales bacterium]